MEITAETIYWITRLDGFKLFLMIIGGLLIFPGTGIPISIVEGECSPWLYLTFLIPCFGALLVLFSLFIPTTKTVAAMYVLPKIISNEKIQQIPDKLLDLSNEWLEELRPKKEKQNGE